MKRMRNVLITLACMMITYIFARDAGIYQIKDIVAKMESEKNDSEKDQIPSELAVAQHRVL